MNCDAILLKDIHETLCHVSVFSGYKLLGPLNNSHFGTKAAKELSKLKADIPAAQHNETLWNLTQFHDSSRVEYSCWINIVETCDIWPRWPLTDVDENLIGTDLFLAPIVQQYFEFLL